MCRALMLCRVAAARLANLGWTKTVGATLVNEFHFSYLRNANKIGQPVGGRSISRVAGLCGRRRHPGNCAPQPKR